MAKTFSVYVEIGGAIAPSLGRAIDATKSRLSTIGGSLAAVDRGVAAVTTGAANGIAAAGRRIQDAGRSLTAGVSAPLALLGFGAARTAFEFEKAGNMLEALGDATKEQRRELELYANELNKKYPQSLTQILQTGNELLKGGLNFEQMKGALDSTLAVSIIGEMDPADVGNMIARTVNSFQLPMGTYEHAMESTGRVADQMTFAAVRTTASLRDMGEAYRYAGGSASAMGVPFEEATGLLMAMAKNGSVGSDAGVALRSALVRMVKMPAKGNAALARVGMDLGDYVKGRAVTAENIVAGLSADGIDAAGVAPQIAKALSNKKIAGNRAKLAAEITKIVQGGVAGAGEGAMDSKVLAENVQTSLTAAASQIDFTRFIVDLRKKIEAGQASIGDVATIFEGRHFSRYQPWFQTDVLETIDSVYRESQGFAQSRYAISIEGIVGNTYEFSAAIEGLAISFGRAGFPTIAQGLVKLTDGINAVAAVSPQLLKYATLTGLALIAFGPIAIMAGASMRAIALLAQAVLFLGRAATIGLAAKLVNLAAGVWALSAAATAGMIARVRTLAAATIVLGAAGKGALFGAMAGSLAAFGRAVLAFPVVALRAVGMAMWSLVANPVGATVAAIVVGLAALGTWIYNNWAGIKTFFSEFGTSFMAGLGPEAGAAIERIGAGFKSVYDWVMKVLGPIDSGGEKWRAWGQGAGQAAASIVTALVTLPSKVASEAGRFASAMADLAQRGWEAFKAIDWASLGSSLIDGIIGGITGAAGRLADAVSNAATGAWNSAKAAIGLGGGDSGVANAGQTSAVELPARALGGPVRRGSPYLVGERGPEIFVPSATGRIETNGTLRRLSSIGATNGRSPLHSPPPEAMVASGVAAEAGGGSTHVRRGDLNVTMTFQGGGDTSMAHEAERAVRRVLARYENEQRGLLSD